MREIETRVTFSIGEKEYLLLIEKKPFKTEVYLHERIKNKRYLIPLPVNISTSTLKEDIEYWLRELRYLFKRKYKRKQ